MDATIAVGYHVNSKEVTSFRIWVANTSKEYIKKVFVLNTELLKNGPKYGRDYFDELVLETKSIESQE